MKRHSQNNQRLSRYRVAKTRRTPSLYTSFPEKGAYNWWLFGRKRPATGRAANGGSFFFRATIIGGLQQVSRQMMFFSPSYPRATGVGLLNPRNVCPVNPFNPCFFYNFGEIGRLKGDVRRRTSDVGSRKNVEKGHDKVVAGHTIRAISYSSLPSGNNPTLQ